MEQIRKPRSTRKILVLLCVLVAAYIGALSFKDIQDLPPLNDGDIIFQTSLSGQVLPVAVATFSLYTHAGIVKKTADGYNVIESLDVVRETPLAEWIDRGEFKRFAVYRHKDLTDAQRKKIIAAARQYYGRPYDIYFYFDASKIYCSELLYLSYQDAGLSVGSVQTFAELNLDNSVTQKLIEQRWESYPACKGRHFTFNQCYDVIKSGKIITPVSIAVDKNFALIYTNYHL